MTSSLCGIGLALVGTLAGAGVRVLLRRLRRGARVRPPWCEVAVGLAWGVTGLVWATGRLAWPWPAVLLGLGWLGTALAAVDLRHHRLPDALTLPALPAALLLVTPLGPATVGRGLAGAAVAVGAHALVRWRAPHALGGGDVKLAASLGVVLVAASWAALPVAAVLAGLLTAVAAAIGGLLGWVRRGAAVPHGPSMLLATWLVTLASATV